MIVSLTVRLPVDTYGGAFYLFFLRNEPSFENVTNQLFYRFNFKERQSLTDSCEARVLRIVTTDM